jgi:hypothetical protein
MLTIHVILLAFADTEYKDLTFSATRTEEISSRILNVTRFLIPSERERADDLVCNVATSDPVQAADVSIFFHSSFMCLFLVSVRTEEYRRNISLDKLVLSGFEHGTTKPLCIDVYYLKFSFLSRIYWDLAEIVGSVFQTDSNCTTAGLCLCPSE